MKILYFYQYFSTPKGSWGTRVFDFAKEWVNEGHEVTVITSVYAKSDLKPEKIIEINYFEGIKVIVLNIIIDNKQSFLKRAWTFLQYSLIASWYAIKINTDIVIASSGPITVGIPGLISKLIRRRKLVFEVRDLWPQGAVEIGVIKNKLLIKLAYRFEKVLYNYSDYIITLSPGMTENIKERFNKTRIDSVPNAANTDLFHNGNKLVAAEKYGDKKIAIYTGNIGEVNNTLLILNAAILLKEQQRNDILFIIIGEGKQKKYFLDKKQSLNLNNLIILDLMPKTELINFLNAATVSLVPLKDTPILNTSSPNKLFESLAIGLPVIQNTNGWLKKILEENNCGFTVDANNAQELVDKIIYLADNPEIQLSMGQNGAKLIRHSFDKKILAKKMIDILTSI